MRNTPIVHDELGTNMGVDVRAVAMYGLFFQNKADALAFVQENGHQEIEELGEEDNDPVLRGMILQGLDYYSGDNFILGWHLELGASMEKQVQDWKEIFPDSDAEPETHLEVLWY